MCFFRGGGQINALMSNNLSMLSTKDCSSTKCMGNWAVKPSFLHVLPNRKKNLCFWTPELCCQMCSGFSGLESVAVFWNTLIILSTVHRDFSSGKRDCVLKHNNYLVNCVQEFNLGSVAVFWNTLIILSTVYRDFSSAWKVWLCSETS